MLETGLVIICLILGVISYKLSQIVDKLETMRRSLEPHVEGSFAHDAVAQHWRLREIIAKLAVLDRHLEFFRSVLPNRPVVSVPTKVVPLDLSDLQKPYFESKP